MHGRTKWRQRSLVTLAIECDNNTLKENILKLIELNGKEVSLECEYVFLHNKYQLIKVL